ncbi:MAG: hypothetical protein KJ638_06045 [Chloroflexi bacterium]|nr:hypothetical protein [Chloroflexota bacterium]
MRIKRIPDVKEIRDWRLEIGDWRLEIIACNLQSPNLQSPNSQTGKLFNSHS